MRCAPTASVAGLFSLFIVLTTPMRSSAASLSGTSSGFIFPFIDCGEVVEDALTPDDFEIVEGVWIDDYDLSVPGSTIVAVIVETTAFEPYIEVSDIDLIDIIDDGPSPLILPLTEDDYVVSVSNFDPLPAATRPYRVGVSCADTEATEIRCGSAIAGQLDQLDATLPDGTWVDGLNFQLPGPSRIRFELSGYGFDPYVLVTDEDGDVIGEGSSPFEITLPGGRYLVFANSFDALADGNYPYVLDARCTPEGCPGDCDGNGTVDVSELVRGVRITLGSATLDECPSFDTSGDGVVAVSELVQAVNATLRGCA